MHFCVVSCYAKDSLSFNNIEKQLPEMFCNNGVFKNFTKFTGKHFYWSLFFNKVTGWRPATLLKKRLQHSHFTVNFEKKFRTSTL